MKMFLTMCGNQRTANWPSTVFCTTERFFGEDVFEKANAITAENAKNKITEQILKLNPSSPAVSVK